MEYFLILLIFLLVGIILELRFNIRYPVKKRLVISFVIMLVGVTWDYFATWRQHWIFTGNGLLGVNLFGLPIEEFIFFFIMPYLAFTIYKIFEEK